MSRSGYVNSTGTRGRLRFLVGYPHAGKSSYANNYVRCPALSLGGDPPVDRPRVVLAGDDFRWALTGHEYLPHAEAHVFSIMDTTATALLRRGFDVLIDETSTSKPTLMRYLRIDPAAEPIFIDTPASVCKERALANNRPWLVRVVDRLEPRLQELRTNWPTIRAELLAQVEHRMVEDVVVAGTE